KARAIGRKIQSSLAQKGLINIQRYIPHSLITHRQVIYIDGRLQRSPGFALMNIDLTPEPSTHKGIREHNVHQVFQVKLLQCDIQSRIRTYRSADAHRLLLKSKIQVLCGKPIGRDKNRVVGRDGPGIVIEQHIIGQKTKPVSVFQTFEYSPDEVAFLPRGIIYYDSRLDGIARYRAIEPKLGNCDGTGGNIRRSEVIL